MNNNTRKRGIKKEADNRKETKKRRKTVSKKANNISSIENTRKNEIKKDKTKTKNTRKKDIGKDKNKTTRKNSRENLKETKQIKQDDISKKITKIETKQVVKQTTKEKKEEIFLKGKTDGFLLIVLTILLALGVLTLLSASSSKGLSDYGDAYSYIKKQVMFIVVGIVFMFGISHINYKLYNHKLLRHLIILASISIIVLVRASGLSEGGAQRWINIGGINFQPSEIIKIGMIVFMASLLTDILKKGQIKDFKNGTIKSLFFVGLISGLIFVLQNHLSAAALIGLVSIVQMLVAGISMAHILGIIIPILLLGIGVLFGRSSGGFRSARIDAWLNPMSDLHRCWMANSTGTICNSFRRIWRTTVLDKVGKSNLSYQNHKMIL